MKGKRDIAKSVGKPDASALSIMKGCSDVLIDKKAIDVLFLDLRKVNSYLDYFIICTGNSIIHCKALAKELNTYFLSLSIKERSKTSAHSPWIVLDYNDIIIHIFTKEAREFYQLERLWADARQIHF